MLDKDPMSYEMATWAWVGVLSAWGGISSYVRKLRLGVVTRFSLVEIIGEVVISGFVGVVTFFICETSGIPQLLSAAIIGISAHMGSRAIFVLEQTVDRFLRKWFSQNID